MVVDDQDATPARAGRRRVGARGSGFHDDLIVATNPKLDRRLEDLWRVGDRESARLGRAQDAYAGGHWGLAPCRTIGNRPGCVTLIDHELHRSITMENVVVNVP